MARALHAERYRKVPKLLKAMREEAGLTQRELADKLRRLQSWVCNSETATRRVDIAEFCEWCRACGVEPKEGLARYLKGP